MYTIRVDAARNRLYVTLVGSFSLEEMTKCGNETIEATRKLRPGYDVITDISRFQTATVDVAKDIARVQAHFRATGVRRGIRVLGVNALSGMQFRRTGKDAQYSADDVATMAEAEQLLDAPR